GDAHRRCLSAGRFARSGKIIGPERLSSIITARSGGAQSNKEIPGCGSGCRSFVFWNHSQPTIPAVSVAASSKDWPPLSAPAAPSPPTNLLDGRRHVLAEHGQPLLFQVLHGQPGGLAVVLGSLQLVGDRFQFFADHHRIEGPGK